jgi:hypothetical protein
MTPSFVVVRLGGGLGNQMFQFATARAVSIRTSQPLFVDLHEGEKFLLDGLAVPDRPTFSRVDAVRCGLPPWRSRRGTRFFMRAARLRGIRYLKPETFGTFLPEAVSVDGPVVLEGHWQSERYFVDVASAIRADFSLSLKPKDRANELANEMKRTDSVAVSFRRGDYLTEMPQEDLPTPEYYANAYERLVETLGTRPAIYAFSDDSTWLAANLPRSFPEATQVSGVHSSTIYEELHLHAAARHQIIAPSSFSWWAAWLNPNPDKIVIAPSRWVYDWAAPDVVPDSWLRVPYRGED